MKNAPHQQAPEASVRPAEAATRPARIELNIRHLALPRGTAIDAAHLSSLIQQRLQAAIDPRHTLAHPVRQPSSPAIDALLNALEPHLLDALRAQGVALGDAK